MGEIYRARDGKLNRDVAIKVLPAALSGDSQYMARFEREAQMLAALSRSRSFAASASVRGLALLRAFDSPATCCRHASAAATQCLQKVPSAPMGQSQS